MKESSKTRLVRSEEFFNTYFNGKVIDIGGGSDAVTENSEVFDFDQGDAQKILEYRDKESYDCVNSSHCLEHMKDVPSALSQWWELVKPGGYMVIVVPHEDLYEQKIWPSVFATEKYGHAATFRLKTNDTWSPVSYDIFELVSALKKSKVIDSEVQDLNYDYSLLGKRLTPIGRKIYKWRRSNNRIKRLVSESVYDFFHDYFWVKSKRKTGKPIDQTTWNALAQIQIIAQKIK
jgi:SAM-dependent methyltransferase